MKPAPIAPDYFAFLTDVKSRIQTARLAAGRAVNHEFVLHYWNIGRSIVEKQTVQGLGESVVERLFSDLRAEFPDMRGFATRSVRNMRRFFQAYGSPVFCHSLSQNSGRHAPYRQTARRRRARGANVSTRPRPSLQAGHTGQIVSVHL